MKVYMAKAFSLIIFIAGISFSNIGLAQKTNQSGAATEKTTNQITHYIYINNVNTREAVLELENTIQQKPNVNFFMAERYPVRCFVMKTTKAISKATFQSWVGEKYQVITYGVGNSAKEQAYIQYKKNFKSKQ
jgi:hypothetical protein